MQGESRFLLTPAISKKQANCIIQHELKPRCLPAVGEGARKDNDFAGVEVQWVAVLRGVVMPMIAWVELPAADFVQPAWVAFHPGEEIFSVLLDEADVAL
jgi:hypothetical protein